eukprot:scaffold96516_cov15-Tisochrysis_lutea.AAC.2
MALMAHHTRLLGQALTCASMLTSGIGVWATSAMWCCSARLQAATSSACARACACACACARACACACARACACACACTCACACACTCACGCTCAHFRAPGAVVGPAPTPLMVTWSGDTSWPPPSWWAALLFAPAVLPLGREGKV